MLETNSFGNRRFVMNSLATVTISACSHFIKEGAINLVHFGSINFG